MKRRTFLTGAFTGTAALALGVSLYTPEVNDNPDDTHRLLFSVLIPIFMDGALPEVANYRDAFLNRTIIAINQTISVLPEDQKQELTQLLTMLESRFGLLILTSSITPLVLRSPEQLNEMLEHWRHHFLEMMQTAYIGLRELIISSYYACPEHWGRLHYAKPTFLDA
ncbi:TAT leader-containing periplasmic protein [Shewanella sp. 1_MG-2023]|uniref:TAT leader-containing periplasmic protein n=1 Tax=Shewanella electrodiphila TaxID=934143 RepID=A0ABT0KP73_9GAMM|nr:MULTISPECIES: TAT leader-containing periplasmic protein [Shewanella]MCC4834141.1 TAT leader-containing periplasmic protein [Shewanella sp. 10N.7]MCL1045636.1 TAT leader-containing periplasmic protein [Shewanella electrodiphila]MDO6611591.1 TAT leader-containing periplasmic protein [Shewanella sp. 7_MG-2023]MDO6771446.1 TAT leader-containing periplasmic protein [Shewanella sp. 2_MG-2023]MDO6793672.1 TAT leader-containing periplasmic protein [Shewanella sp. 1_MG-2023]